MSPVPTTCPPPAEWLRLADGEVTENRAAEIRAHAAGCRACAGELAGVEALVSLIGAPVPGLPSQRALEAVMERLDEAPPARRRWSTPFMVIPGSTIKGGASRCNPCGTA